MTREEAKAFAERVIDLGFKDETQEFCEFILKLLEQEPCEDCISRQAVINAIANTCFWLSADNWEELTKCINSISPTTPQPKIGHWIEGQTDNPNIHNILCSCCFEGYPSKGHANSQYTKEKYRWCSNCGARMIESEG